MPASDLRLAEVRYVDDRGEAGDEPREHVHQPDARRHRDPGVTRAGRREANRVERAPDDRAVQQHDVNRKDQQEDGELRRDNIPQVTLSQKEKPRRKAAVVDRRLRDSFGDPTKQRERAKRHDERRDSETRDEHGVERAAGAADEQRDERRERGMEPPVAARGAKDHR